MNDEAKQTTAAPAASGTVQLIAAILLVLGGIVIIRTFLSLSLDVEINGHWPWETTKLAQKQAQGEPPLAAAE